MSSNTEPAAVGIAPEEGAANDYSEDEDEYGTEEEDEETDEEDYEDYYDDDVEEDYWDDGYDDDDSAEEDDGVVNFPAQERAIPPYESDGEEYPDSGSESRPYTDEDFQREEDEFLDVPSHRIEPPFRMHPLQGRHTPRSAEIISTLGPGLLDYIFSFHQVRRWKYGFEPAKEFCALARVNKHWCPVAQERLYYRVSVDKASRSRRLVRTLSQAPHLANLVRDLRLGMYDTGREETLNHARAILLCPNLHRIHLSGWNGYVLPELKRAIRQQTDIRVLHITRHNLCDRECDAFCDDVEILAWIKSWPQFSEIWIGNHTWGVNSKYTKHDLRKKLEAMGIKVWGPGSGKRI